MEYCSIDELIKNFGRIERFQLARHIAASVSVIGNEKAERIYCTPPKPLIRSSKQIAATRQALRKRENAKFKCPRCGGRTTKYGFNRYGKPKRFCKDELKEYTPK